MESSRRILVIGATGLVGQPVARALLDSGYGVRVMSTRPEAARETFDARFEIVHGDITDPSTLPAALEGCHGVHLGVSSSAGAQGADAVEHLGAANVTRAALDAGIERIIFVSGSTAFPENSSNPGVKAKLDAEREIVESGLPYTIFCPTWFMESMTRFINGTKASAFGKFRHPWHWIAADDFARMVVRAFELPEAAGRRLFAHGPDALTLLEAFERYRVIVEPELNVRTTPLWQLRIIATLTRRPAIKRIIPFMRYMSRTPEGGDPTEANELLGAPETTLDDWLRAILEAKRIAANVGEEEESCRT